MTICARFIQYIATCSILCLAAGCSRHNPASDVPPTTRKYHEVYGNAVNLYQQGPAARKRARYYLDSTYATFDHVPAIGRYLRYTYKAWILYNDRNYDSANLYTDSAIAELQNNNIAGLYPDDYIHALLEKGHVLMALHQVELAYDCYLQARTFARNNAHTRNVHELSYDMGMTLYRQGRYTEAANNFKTGYAEARALIAREGTPFAWANPIYRMQEMLANTGLCYTKAKQYDSAEKYYQMALAFIDTSKHHISTATMADAARGVIYGNMGTNYLLQGDTTMARKLYNESIALNLQPGGDLADALKTTIKLSEIFLNEGKLADVTRLLNATNMDTLALQRPDLERDYVLLQTRYYDKAGNKPLANQYFRRHTYLRDSIQAANRSRDNSDISNYLARKEQQHRIEILERDNRIARLLTLAALLFGIMVSAAVVLAVIGYRRSRRNVASLAKLNQQIEWQKDQLEKKNREKDRLLSAVAHDLRNPVGSIVYLTEQLHTTDTPLIPADTAMEIVSTAAQTAMGLINELNEFAPDTPYVARRVQTDVNKLIQECVDMLAYRAVEKQQQLVCHLPEQPVFAMADAGKIKRIIINLLSNAIKFSNTGGYISVLLLTNENEVVVEVNDNGIGIAPAMMNNLFDMFTPTRRKGTAGEHSYGLGLSISAQIAHAHGGRITVNSAEGRGSTFCLWLPYV
jgi:signal transduction histidine kinase